MKEKTRGWDGLRHSWGESSPRGMAKGSLLSSRVAQLIERHIAKEGLKHGDRLPSGRDLAEMFAVSRTVIRDAVSALEQRGLLESRPGSGVFVVDGSSGAVREVLDQMLRQEAISFEELAEVRHLLEIHSAVVAVTRATPDNIEGMSSAISRMQTARDAIAFVEADVEFHEELGKASGNRVLAAFLESLRPFLFQGMLAGARLEGTQAVAVQEHTEILDAISKHDEQLVRRLMDAHLQRSYREWHEAELTGPRS